MLILKTTMLFQMLIANKMLVANKVGSIKGGESTQKSVESKCGKLFKSQKLARSKKLSKSGNSPNFIAKEARPSFLTSGARKVFNHFLLAFIKPTIL